MGVAHGTCPEDRRSGNARTGFQETFRVFLLKGELRVSGELRGSRLPVLLPSGVLAGGQRARMTLPRWFSQAMQFAAGSTRITYADIFSRVEIVLDYENKSDRVRAGLDRQAGGARRFPGSASREDPGNGHGSRR